VGCIRIPVLVLCVGKHRGRYPHMVLRLKRPDLENQNILWLNTSIQKTSRILIAE
jgi:hypothetical protein